MKTYRTLEQLTDIAEQAYNGNWSSAAADCVEYGFYANDIITMDEEHDIFVDKYDIAFLIEIATKLRYKTL